MCMYVTLNRKLIEIDGTTSSSVATLKSVTSASTQQTNSIEISEYHFSLY